MPTGSGDSKPETELTVQEFVELHKPQLTSSGVPERFWSTLHHKLKSEVCVFLKNINTYCASV